MQVMVTDFRVLVDEIGLDDASIAAALAQSGTELSEKAVRDYRTRGAEPNHWRGELLIALWCRVTGRGREALPKRSVDGSEALGEQSQ
jgi:hypothetical protein